MIKSRLVIGSALLFLLTFFTPHASLAQEYRRLEVFGEYSNLRFDAKSIGFASDSNLQGFNGGAQFKLAPQFGVVAEVGGQYGTDLHSYQVLIGPQATYRWHNASLFGHVLFGQAQNRVEIGSLGTTNKCRAVALGGGIDYNLSPRFAVRVIEADYLHTHTFEVDQTNIKLSAGLVYRFSRFMGKEHKKSLGP